MIGGRAVLICVYNISRSYMLICVHCGYNGHTIEYCRKRIRDENREAARMAQEKQQVPQSQSPFFSQDGYAFPAFSYRSIPNWPTAGRYFYEAASWSLVPKIAWRNRSWNSPSTKFHAGFSLKGPMSPPSMLDPVAAPAKARVNMYAVNNQEQLFFFYSIIFVQVLFHRECCCLKPYLLNYFWCWLASYVCRMSFVSTPPFFSLCLFCSWCRRVVVFVSLLPGQVCHSSE